MRSEEGEGSIERRRFLKSAAAVVALGATGACRWLSAPGPTTGQPMLQLPALRLGIDRITRITVCTRPFRAHGPRTDVEKIGAKTVVHNYGHGGSGWSLSWGAGSMAAASAMAAGQRDVAVVGCGAMGLTTAICLQRAGARVTIYAKDLPPNVRSSWATGLYTPDSRIALEAHATPEFKRAWAQMSRQTYEAFQSFLGVAGTPVEYIDQYAISDEPGPRRRDEPEGKPRFAELQRELTPDLMPVPIEYQPGSHPFGPRYVRRNSQLMFNLASYQRILLQDFAAAGGKIEIAEFRTPADFARVREKTLVNCTGYGARALLGDTSIVPVRGQCARLISQLESTYGLRYKDASFVPRRDGLLLQIVGENDYYGYGDESTMPDRMEAEHAVTTIASLFPAATVAVKAALFSLAMFAAAPAFAQADGAQVFQRSCVGCHTGAPDSRAPAPDALRSRSPQAIVESLMTGAMRPQGSRLSGPERRAVAEFLTSKRLEGDVTGAQRGRCTVPGATPVRDQQPPPGWNGWSPTPTNTRYQPADQAGLTAATVPRLRLKWTLGFPDASVAWAQPTVSGGRVFVGSQNGTVYALNAGTGCIHWTFSAAGGVRTAIAVAAPTASSPGLVFFGDTAANAYALNSGTGAVVWTRKIDDHPFARITGSPTLHEGRLYVPVSSYEEAQGADPQYACCTFRGSVSALDAATGAVIWKTYMISDAPQRRGTSAAGVPLWGPAGSGIWSAPTVDVNRRALYVATGNAYSAPAASSSDAVVALDLATGSMRWMRQVTPNDVYLNGCRPTETNPNCPEVNGPDVDFGSPPMLARASGRDVIVIGQKSGIGYGMDPDKQGEVLWQYRAGQGGTLGGMEWGGAVEDGRAYFAVSDIQRPNPGGLHAVNVLTGERVWFASPAAPICGTGPGCNAAQSAAITVVPGVIFSGSNDGALRAYSSTDGTVLWQYDSNREFESINGIPAKGASMIGPGPVVAGGMVYVNSGYGGFGGRPGNVLLAFGVE